MSRKQKYLKELKKLKENIVREYKPEKIILFGSLAWGKVGPDSDIDLFIIKKTAKPRLERQREVSRILLGREAPVDILVFTPEETMKRKKMGDDFVIDILKTGKLIYAR